MATAMMVKLKKEGKGFVKHKTAVTDSDKAKIFESDAVNPDTPLGLQNKVFLDVMTYFGQRGCGNLMTKILYHCTHGHSLFEYKQVLTDRRTDSECDWRSG